MTVKCDECDYTSSYKHYLQEHKEVVHEGTIYRCKYDGCSSTFTSRNNIGDHVLSIHEKGDFPCNVCDRHFPTKRSLKVHVGSTHAEKKFFCSKCDYKAGFKGWVNRHVKKVHLKVNGFSYCKLCDYKSTNSKSLQNHVNKVHKELFEENQDNPQNVLGQSMNVNEDNFPIKDEYVEENIKEEDVINDSSDGTQEVECSIKDEFMEGIIQEEDIISDDDEYESLDGTQAKFLCPITSCTFSLKTKRKSMETEHFQLNHPEYKAVKFIKL